MFDMGVAGGQFMTSFYQKAIMCLDAKFYKSEKNVEKVKIVHFLFFTEMAFQRSEEHPKGF